MGLELLEGERLQISDGGPANGEDQSSSQPGDEMVLSGPEAATAFEKGVEAVQEDTLAKQAQDKSPKREKTPEELYPAKKPAKDAKNICNSSGESAPLGISDNVTKVKRPPNRRRRRSDGHLQSGNILRNRTRSGNPAWHNTTDSSGPAKATTPSLSPTRPDAQSPSGSLTEDVGFSAESAQVDGQSTPSNVIEIPEASGESGPPDAKISGQSGPPNEQLTSDNVTEDLETPDNVIEVPEASGESGPPNEQLTSDNVTEDLKTPDNVSEVPKFSGKGEPVGKQSTSGNLAKVPKISDGGAPQGNLTQVAKGRMRRILSGMEKTSILPEGSKRSTRNLTKNVDERN